jgi:RNA polymerase sigma-70 factor (ECF subfamily)
MSSSNRALLALSVLETVQPPDRELVEGLFARDPEAAVLTYRKFAPRIYRIVARSMGPRADAEDITQDVFLRVFDKIHTLRDADALESFILSIALRVIKWQLRKQRIRSVLHLSGDGLLPERSVPASDAEAREALRRLYDCLDRLPASERTVFVLRHIEAMELPEVAKAVGASLSTTKRRLRRALETVSVQLDLPSLLGSHEVRRKKPPTEGNEA